MTPSSFLLPTALGLEGTDGGGDANDGAGVSASFAPLPIKGWFAFLANLSAMSPTIEEEPEARRMIGGAKEKECPRLKDERDAR
jgi:hypothetical protein